MSSSIPSSQILTAHAQPFRGARDLVFCLKVPLDSMLVWASSGGSGETARMRRLAWTFAARIGGKYQIRLSRSNCKQISSVVFVCLFFILSQQCHLKHYVIRHFTIYSVGKQSSFVNVCYHLLTSYVSVSVRTALKFGKKFGKQIVSF